MMRTNLSLRCRIGALATLMALSASFAAHADEATPVVKAVWQVQEVFLSYNGYTTFYSCDGLRDKVAAIIKQLGAHQSSYVTSAGCDKLTGPARINSVHIFLATPRTATPEVIAANAQDKKRAGVLAKLQHQGPPIDGAETFDAIRKSVVLPSKDQIGAEGVAGDCELLEVVRNQVIKKIDARVIQDRLGCTPNQGRASNPTLEVEVLVAKSKPAAAP